MHVCSLFMSSRATLKHKIEHLARSTHYKRKAEKIMGDVRNLNIYMARMKVNQLKA